MHDYPGAFWVGSPRRYTQVPTNAIGPGYGPASNPYSTIVNTRGDMTNQPAFVFYPPMGPGRLDPDPEQMRIFQFTGVDGSLPTFFRPANRAAVTVNTETGGKPEGLRMLVVSPMRYNAAVLKRHTIKDTRLLPGRSGRPTRRYIPGIPVGS